MSTRPENTASNIARNRGCNETYLYIANNILCHRGMTPAICETLLATRDYEKIENEAKAEKLIMAAVDGAMDGFQKLGVDTSFNSDQLADFILHDNDIYPHVAQVALRMFFIAPEMAVIVPLCALTSLHNQWISDNSADFGAYLERGYIYLFLPLYLVGLNRVIKYYDEVVGPICNAVGCYTDILTISNGYRRWQKEQVKFPTQPGALTDYIITMAEQLSTDEDSILNQEITRTLMDRTVARRVAIQCLIENNLY